MGLLKPFVITALSLFVLTYFVHEVRFASFTILLIASGVLTLLQLFVKPILKLLFLPINIITLGLFSWVVNVIIVWLAIALVPGFHVDQITLFGYHLNWGFSLLFVSFVLSVVQSGVALVF